VTDLEWLHGFRTKVTRQRVPITGTLELTNRCNLRCVHCYLGPQEDHWSKSEDEMSTAKVLSVIDEIVEAGCLYLLITGGDPFVRDDFAEIYRHARRSGLIVTVFCNGTLAKDGIVELFKEYPPSTVEITLYGATGETYEAVTGVRGSYSKCLRGVGRLVDAGIRVGLKTVLTTLNSHELEEMRGMAKELGVPFRLDGALFPHLSSRDKAPLGLRLPPEVVVRQELSDPENLQRWVEYVGKGFRQSASGSLYQCGAGVTGFNVDAYGHASPCLMVPHHRHSLAESSFSSLWSKELEQLRRTKPRAGYDCGQCEMISACGGCPAFNVLETGHEDVKSEYVCETTRLRWGAIQSELGAQSTAPTDPAEKKPSQHRGRVSFEPRKSLGPRRVAELPDGSGR